MPKIKNFKEAAWKNINNEKIFLDLIKAKKIGKNGRYCRYYRVSSKEQYDADKKYDGCAGVFYATEQQVFTAPAYSLNDGLAGSIREFFWRPYLAVCLDGNEFNCQITEEEWKGWTFLDYTVYHGLKKQACKLLELGTPNGCASASCYQEEKINPYQKFISGRWQGWSLLVYSVYQGYIEIASSLMENMKYREEVDDHQRKLKNVQETNQAIPDSYVGYKGWSLLTYCVYKQYTGIVVRLLDLGADLTSARIPSDGRPLLLYAISEGYSEIAAALYQHGADLTLESFNPKFVQYTTLQGHTFLAEKHCGSSEEITCLLKRAKNKETHFNDNKKPNENSSNTQPGIRYAMDDTFQDKLTYLSGLIDGFYKQYGNQSWFNDSVTTEEFKILLNNLKIFNEKIKQEIEKRKDSKEMMIVDIEDASLDQIKNTPQYSYFIKTYPQLRNIITKYDALLKWVLHETSEKNKMLNQHNTLLTQELNKANATKEHQSSRPGAKESKRLSSNPSGTSAPSTTTSHATSQPTPPSHFFRAATVSGKTNTGPRLMEVATGLPLSGLHA